MRGFLAVVDTAFRLFFRDKHGLFWGVAFPLMMMGLIGSVFGGNMSNLTLTTSIVYESADPLTEAMVAAFESVPTLRVVEENREDALAALRKGDRSLVVVLPTFADVVNVQAEVESAVARASSSAAGVAESVAGNEAFAGAESNPSGIPGDVESGGAVAAASGGGAVSEAAVGSGPSGTGAPGPNPSGTLSGGGFDAGTGSGFGAGTGSGFGAAPAPEPASVEVFYDDKNFEIAQAGIAIVGGIVDEFNQRLTQRVDLLQVTSSGVSAHQLSMFDFLLPGILAMVLMQTGLMGVTAVMTSYRERLLLKRVLATPFPPVTFLAGLVARFTVTNLLQGVIIVIVGVLVFKAQVIGSYGNMFVLAMLGSITFLSMGFAISTMSKTPDGANTFGSAVSFPMMFLSGTFWPREFIPDALQPVIGALPLTPLVEALRGVATQGDTLAMHASGMLYLVAWAVVSLLVAARRFRWE